jgi:hypothetical protein
LAVGCEEGGATVVIVMIVVGIKLLAVVLGWVVLYTLPVPLAKFEADDPCVVSPMLAVTVVVVMGIENENFVAGDEFAAVLVG